MEKETIPGVILVLTCHKYYSKLRKLNKTDYNGWKVIYVLGNIFQEKEYILDNDNFLHVKTEDSYIYLYKKLIKSLEAVYQLYNITDGILRCGDDLIFIESSLQKLLDDKNKSDFIGRCYDTTKYNYDLPYSQYLTENREDWSMLQYYNRNKEDASDILHNVSSIDLYKYRIVPTIPKGLFAIGVLFYISNNCTYIVTYHLKT